MKPSRYVRVRQYVLEVLAVFGGIGNTVLVFGLHFPMSVWLIVLLCAALVLSILAIHNTERWMAVYGAVLVASMVVPGWSFIPIVASTSVLFFIVGAVGAKRTISVFMIGMVAIIATYAAFMPDTMVTFFSGIIPTLVLTLLGMLFGWVFRTWEDLEEQSQHLLLTTRTKLARDMHDSLAYELSQISLRAKQAAVNPAFSDEAQQEFASIQANANQSLQDVRTVLRNLRNPDMNMAELSDGHGNEPDRRSMASYLDAPSLGHALPNNDGPRQRSGISHSNRPGWYSIDALLCAVDRHKTTLEDHGYEVALVVSHDGQPCSVPGIAMEVSKEISANILRHAPKDHPVSIMVTTDGNDLRIISTNAVRDTQDSELPASQLGLLGLQESMAPHGGTLRTLVEDGTWMIHVVLPTSTVVTGLADCVAEETP